MPVATIFAVVVFFALWVVLFLAALLVDEDVNHWNWATDVGPGLIANIRMLAMTGLIAAVIPAGAWWLLR